MKCVRGIKFDEVFRCSDKHAEELVETSFFEYASKEEWKQRGRKRVGSQGGAPISDHPRSGSPPRHGSKRKRR